MSTGTEWKIEGSIQRLGQETPKPPGPKGMSSTGVCFMDLAQPGGPLPKAGARSGFHRVVQKRARRAARRERRTPGPAEAGAGTRGASACAVGPPRRSVRV